MKLTVGGTNFNFIILQITHIRAHFFLVGVVNELVPLVLLVVKHVRNPRVARGQIDQFVRSPFEGGGFQKLFLTNFLAILANLEQV